MRYMFGGLVIGGTPHTMRAKIWPAGPTSTLWSTMENLQRCVNTMDLIKPTHLFMLGDIWALNPLAKAIERMSEATGMRSCLYFPVDAPLEVEWLPIIEAVDAPVSYTAYGLDMASNAIDLAMKDQPSSAGGSWGR